ncbi:MAG TPA: nuclear transport factor 2 family protein [Kofleriaceae bacterium]|nr:nuclear transport factor 2 family protein [Kofleriaceae bacterium]
MSTIDNKQRMQQIFAQLAEGNGKLLIDGLADDVSWTLIGTNSWSGTYRGKQAVRTELFAPLFAQFADRYTNTAHRFIAEDDMVVVECRGRVTTRSGRPYENTYCWVCRFAGGLIREVVEYMDTELVATALAARQA